MSAAKRLLRHAVKRLLPPGMGLRIRTARHLKVGPAELRLLRTMRGDGDFIDVGANEGFWAYVGSRRFRHVHAFEPDQALAEHIAKALPSNVVVHQVALSDHEGQAELLTPVFSGERVHSRASLEPTANDTPTHTTQKVPLRTLDSFNFTGVSALKIDVEGHEAATLAGARETIKRERPVMIVEIEERHHPGTSEKIIADVCELGMKCFYLRGGKLVPFTPGEIETLQAKPPSGFDFSDERSYVNNFIFIPEEQEQAVVKQLNGGLSA